MNAIINDVREIIKGIMTKTNVSRIHNNIKEQAQYKNAFTKNE